MNHDNFQGNENGNHRETSLPEEYADALNAIISELEEYDWQVIAKPVDLDSGERCCLSIRDALYVDKYQVGFSYSDVIEATFFQKCDYQEVNRIVPDCKNPIWFKNTQPSLDVMIQEADSRTGEGCSFSVSKDRYTSSELSF